MPIILGKLHENRQPLLRGAVSNNVPAYELGEYETPAACREESFKALVDTGATNSVIDKDIQSRLMLKVQNQKRVLFPNMTSAEHYPAFTCELFFCANVHEDFPRHEWPDLVDMLAFDLSGRAFQAVIGMDILCQGNLRIESCGAVVFEY